MSWLLGSSASSSRSASLDSTPCFPDTQVDLPEPGKPTSKTIRGRDRGLKVICANRPLYLIGAGPGTIRLWGLVISLKRFLGANADDARAQSRLAWLILEAVACHAVESDPAERLAFQAGLRQIVTRMEQSESGDGMLVLTGE